MNKVTLADLEELRNNPRKPPKQVKTVQRRRYAGDYSHSIIEYNGQYYTRAALEAMGVKIT